MIVARLATLDPAALRERARETGDATFTLAEAWGERRTRRRRIRRHDRAALQPASPRRHCRADADAAVRRLLALLPAAPPESRPADRDPRAVPRRDRRA
jgi:hypothetical protein